MSFTRVVVGLSSALLLIGVGVNGPVSALSDVEAVFTLEGLTSAKLEVVPIDDDAGARSGAPEDFIVARAGSEVAIVDLTLAGERSAGHRAMVAAASEFVDLSWEASPGASGYVIARDEVEIAVVEEQAFRDLKVKPGGSYLYRIVPLLLDKTADAPTFGLRANVPVLTGKDQLVMEEAATLAAAIQYNNARVIVRTFIPQEFVPAPPVGCTYGSGYKFLGDNRGFTTGIAQGRTFTSAKMQWTSTGAGLQSGPGTMGTTYVFTNAGAYVATATASNANNKSKVLGWNSSSVDFRFEIAGSDPFCTPIQGIDGAFTMSISRSGSWVIISGSHRQMPNWEVNIGHAPDGFNFTSTAAYQRPYANVACLVAIACPFASMSGWYGTY